MRSIAAWAMLLGALACTPARPAVVQRCGAGQPAPVTTTRERRAIQAATRAGPIGPPTQDYGAPLLPEGFTLRANDFVPDWLDAMGANRRRTYYGAIDTNDVIAEVSVSVQAHATVPAPTTAAWADAVLARHEAAARESSAETVRDFVAVYTAAWGDAHSRLHLEYAIVQKGCERLESYHHFMQTDAELLEVDMEVFGNAPPELTAHWLHAFFDVPLGSNAPNERRSAYGHRSNL